DAQGHAVEDDPLPLRSSDKPPTDTKGSEFRRSLIIGGIVLLLIVLVVVGWFVNNRLRSGAPEIPPAISEPAAVAESSPSPAEMGTEAREGMSLNIEAVQDVWIVLHADGQRVLSGTMRAGEERSFDASEQFEFETIGNARGVTLSINGIELPPVGERGQVIRNRVFTLEDAGTLMRTQATSS
ncbi:MAG TPA: DUF4115 domain-containing protein, partial [Thermoanaerobaculia bacterium]|nr:DUF4115 domain-containing protein [Thermoanaerobaculia bacterium]